MTALKVFRCQLGPHLDDIAAFFVEHGITFSTYAPLTVLLPRPLPSQPPSSLPLLGCRPASYQFDIADFAAYLSLRGTFLQGEPRAHVALRMGGIIGRLARQVLPSALGAEGPSAEAIEGNGVIVCSGDQYLVEDKLSEQELDLLSGVYLPEHEGQGMGSSSQKQMLIF